MQKVKTNNGEVIIYANTIESGVIDQVKAVADSPLGVNANIRLMPDCHVGKGCTIGTTMYVTDKVCPNLVGVDIGCSVRLVKTDIDFASNLEKLDKCIRKCIPFGTSRHNRETISPKWFQNLRCWWKIRENTLETASRSIGTLGGGNHFIEAYEDGWLAVHTGSRNIGLTVANIYQQMALEHIKNKRESARKTAIQEIPEKEREAWIKENKEYIPQDLAYLEGQEMEDYLHDLAMMQNYAKINRAFIMETILVGMRGRMLDVIDSTHNYIDLETRILRKGATDASKGVRLVIPMNMRDGMLVCRGKGNPDWNYSAPHGAGRLYGRGEAKRKFTVAEMKLAMSGIYSTCINEDTVDEAPMVYKSMEEIKSCIKETVDIEMHLKPIYNFKASE